MTRADYLAMAPHLVLMGLILAQLLMVSFYRRHGAMALLSAAGMIVALAAVGPALEVAPRSVTPLLLFDHFAAYFNVLFLLAGLVTVLIGFRYLRHRAGDNEEFFILVTAATIGAMVLASATHFATLLLGLEVLSISLYALVAYPEEGHPPLEAALKYLVLSGVASTTILFGAALLYNASGTLLFAELGRLAVAGSPYVMVGHGLVLAGLAFKLSLVPFHMWTPDVYQGAPAPVTGFLATVSKTAAFALLLRYVLATDFFGFQVLFGAVCVVAVLSMVAGNLLALLQRSVKRVLAYSSTAHFGYLLIGLLALAVLPDPDMAIETSLVYVAGYVAMTMAAFSVIAVLSDARLEDVDDVDDYAGLFWKRPILAAVLTVAMLSLAGIPLTVGFIAKFYLFAAGIEGALWSLLWALIVGSAIAIYYYLRIVLSMSRVSDGDGEQPGRSWGTVVAAVLGIVVLAAGIYPAPLIETVRHIIGRIG